MNKVKAHLWTLPRWFATPLFASPAILGGLIAGGMTVSSWMGVLAALLIMAGGHSFNTVLDYSWTGLDRGGEGERSVEKNYTAGQSIIASGVVSATGVSLNALAWYAASVVPLAYITVSVGPKILVVAVSGMLVTFAYARSKFNWTHEIVLAVGSGPLPALAGMYATTASPPVWTGLLASVPAAVLPAFIGLPIDEWPDAEANLKKGVKSLAYKVRENGVALEWYLSSWILFLMLFQLFLIVVGVLTPLSAIAFILWPVLMAMLVFLKKDFRRWAGRTVIVGAFYPALMVLGHYLGLRS